MNWKPGLITLKYLTRSKVESRWPKLAERYLALAPAARTGFLTNTVDHVAPSDRSPWTMPRDINSIGWFASPSDMCNVFASLAVLARQPNLAPLVSILDISGQFGLSTSRWRSVWYKGGSEPGVLTVKLRRRGSDEHPPRAKNSSQD